MKKMRLYSEEEAARILGCSYRELSEKSDFGLITRTEVNGRRYYKINMPGKPPRVKLRRKQIYKL